LITLPNSVGIDPASANEDVFKASGRLWCSQTGKMSERGRTVQLVATEVKVRHVDELAKFGGDQPCQRKEDVFD
jgi:hypothetical protein